MPRFYFHYQNGSGRVEDAEGIILPDEEAAWFQAVRSARLLFGEDLSQGEVGADLRIEIADEEGRSVLDMPLEQVVRIAA